MTTTNSLLIVQSTNIVNGHQKNKWHKRNGTDEKKVLLESEQGTDAIVLQTPNDKSQVIQKKIGNINQNKKTALKDVNKEVFQTGGAIASIESQSSVDVGNGFSNDGYELIGKSGLSPETDGTDSVKIQTEKGESALVSGNAGGISNGQAMLLGTFGLLATGGIATAIIRNQSSGSQSSNTTDNTQITSNENRSVSINVAAGPIIEENDLSVEIRDLRGNLLVDDPIEYIAGQETVVDIGSYLGGVVVTVKSTGDAPDFIDEASGKRKDLSSDIVLMAMSTVEDDKSVININPITTIAAVRAGLNVSDGSGSIDGRDDADKIEVITVSNANVAKALGIKGSLTEQTPITTIDPQGNVVTETANHIGLLLAAMSGVDSTKSDMSYAIISIANGINETKGIVKLDPDIYNLLINGALIAGIDEVSVNSLRNSIKRLPKLSLSQSSFDGVSLAEATATNGIVEINAEDRSIITVSISDGVQTLIKTMVANGSTQAIVLTEDEVSKLSNGKINISYNVVYPDENVFESSSDSFTLDTVAPDAPTLALGSGVSTGATSAEATASGGVVTVSGESDASIVVTFTSDSDSTKTVTKTLTGTGSAQAVVLTSSDLTTLGNGKINVSATQTDKAGNAGTSPATTSFDLDTVAPEVATTAYSPAENQTAVAILAANESVTWSLGSGADTSLFTLTDTGSLSFISAPNYENRTNYTANVIATDIAGNSTTQAITVNVTDVNESPLVGSSISQQTAVVGQAFNFVVPSQSFSDPDTSAPNNTLTWSAVQVDASGAESALPSWLSFNAQNRTFSGTATTVGSVSVKVKVTDGGNLTAEQTFTINEVALPTFTSQVNGITNLDVNSDIVLTASEAVSAVAGKYIHIVADGGDGYDGVKATDATSKRQFDIAVDSDLVTISGNTITINPDADFALYLGTNYHIEIDEGAFITASGQVNTAIDSPSELAFSTVTPGEASDSGLASAASSKIMHAGSDAAVEGRMWLSIVGLGDVTFGTEVQFNLSNNGYVIVGANDVDPSGANGDPEWLWDGMNLGNKYYVGLLNFGADDTIFVQDAFKNAANKNDVTLYTSVWNDVNQVDIWFGGTNGLPSSALLVQTTGAIVDNEELYETPMYDWLKIATENAQPMIFA